MRISILTLFPEMFVGPFDHSIVKIARQKGLVDINLVNIRNFGIGKHKVVDDKSYGGGVGMVMRVDVLEKAIASARDHQSSKEKVVLFDPRGKTYTQKTAKAYTKLDHLILVCGHYEGVDERIRKAVDEEVSIGDFILTGGEIPAMVIIDSVIRLVKGVLKHEATVHESFSEGPSYLEHPHYTKPHVFKGLKVPDVLLSGNHPKINEWKKRKSSIKKFSS